VAIAKVIAEAGILSVVGGGDSEKAIKAAGVASKISHIHRWRRFARSLASNCPESRLTDK
jgi:hypothetical protein